MASRKAKKLREEVSSAEIIAFPVIVRREIGESAKLPFPVVPARPSVHVASKAAPKAANENDRPTLPMPRRGRWWEIAIVLSAIVHVDLFAAMWERNNYDLERAAGAAAASNDGVSVVPVEIMLSETLPSAQAPIEATEPDETKVAKSAAKNEEKSKKEDKADTAPPKKNDEATDVVPTAKESPNPNKEKREQKKKKTSAASHTAAASPSRAAASGSHGRAGAGGRLVNGGTANVSSYRSQVFAHLQRYKSYPSGASRSGLRAAVVHFTLGANGRVISASLGQSSGAPAFDRAALSMVHRASPFPPIPSGLGSSLAFNAPIRFQ
jgi:TonB family protein